jgi:1-acyl-sn-glycerol-3-phosphate acyltransferase
MVALLSVPLAFSVLVDRRRRCLNWAAYLWAWLLVRLAGCSLKVEGREHIETLNRFVIVANHQSYFDIFVLICLLKKVPHFLAKKELFGIPIFGQLLALAQVLKIDRQDPDAAVETIKKSLNEGMDRPIAIFPEGTRTPDGHFQAFRKKGLNLLMETGLPFVPACIKGTRDVMPKRSYLVRPAEIKVKLGEPFVPGVGLQESGKDAVRDRLWRWIRSELTGGDEELQG